MSSTNEGKFVSVVAKAILGATFGYLAYRSVKARYGHCRAHKKHCGGEKRCGGGPKRCGDSDGEAEGGCRRKCGGKGEGDGAGGEKKHWPEPKLPKNVAVPGVARLPVFSSASVIGKTIFVSGVLGTKATPTDGTPAGPLALVEGGLRAEVRQTMDNIATILRGVMTQALPQGCALPPAFNVWAQVAKCNVYLRDTGAAPFGEMNEEYAKYFANVPNPPARMTSAGVGLALGAAVEIEVIAKLPFRRRKHRAPGGGHHGFVGFGGRHHHGKHHSGHSGYGKQQCGGKEEAAAPAAAAAVPAAAAGSAGAAAAAAAGAKDEKQN